MRRSRRIKPEHGPVGLAEPGDERLARVTASEKRWNTLARITHPTPVALDSVAASLNEFWSQETVGSANGNLFKVAKGTGATNWHSHDDQDEVFIVTAGELVVEFRTGDVTVGAGELLIVPQGVEHRPRAEGEARFLIVGRTITSNDGGGKPAWSTGGGAASPATA